MHLETYWEDTFCHFVPAEEQRSYLTNMSREGTWGGEIELQAYSQRYNTMVRVYDEHNAIIKEYAPENIRDTKHVRYVRGHYDALQADSCWT